MPLLVQPISRRRFLATSLGASAALLAGCRTGALAGAAGDPNRFALLSDTHVPGDPQTRGGPKGRQIAMAEHFARATAEVAALTPRPAAAIVTGDCVYLKGLVEDYRQLAALLPPLRAAGVPLHLVMGNHDNRESFRSVLAAELGATSLLESHQVAVVAAPHANFFLLDSLEQTNVTPGALGPEQLNWLAAALDARRDRPAIVCAHHHPEFGPANSEKPGNGLRDAEALFALLAARPHVKAYVYGHTHVWQVAQHASGIHLVNLPALAYVFDPAQPSGWVEAGLRPDGMDLTLHALDPRHPRHGERLALAWRAG